MNYTRMKKEIEKVWWCFVLCTVIFGCYSAQVRFDPPYWMMGAFGFSFFGFLLSSIAWLFVSHLEYVKGLQDKIEELEKKNQNYQ